MFKEQIWWAGGGDAAKWAPINSKSNVASHRPSCREWRGGNEDGMGRLECLDVSIFPWDPPFNGFLSVENEPGMTEQCLIINRKERGNRHFHAFLRELLAAPWRRIVRNTFSCWTCSSSWIGRVTAVHQCSLLTAALLSSSRCVLF